MTIKLEEPPQRRKGFVPAILLLFLTILTFLLVHFTPSQTAMAQYSNIRLYTNNIRYDNRNLAQGESYWEKRAPLISESIRFHTQAGPSVVCLQEVLYNQVEDILANLNKKSEGKGKTEEDKLESSDLWDYYGLGRTDGKKLGEFSPIFFKNSQWELVSSKTWWLSETPEKPSRGWDAVLERIVTVVILKSKINGQKVKVLNTHFDHIGVTARRELAKLIMSKMDQGPEPAFLCGDFNTEPKDEPYKLLLSSGFKDSRVQGEIYGYNTTFTGFDHNNEANTIIDYIWAGNGTVWQDYGVLPNYFGFYMSDHRPVVADYLI